MNVHIPQKFGKSVLCKLLHRFTTVAFFIFSFIKNRLFALIILYLVVTLRICAVFCCYSCGCWVCNAASCYYAV